MSLLRMRKQQMDAFAEAERRAFEDHMVATFREHWREAFDAQGEAAVRDFIREWAPEGMAHGIEKERDLAQYLNIMFALVTDFDEDPRKVPWVLEVVDDASLTAMAKVYTLYVKLYEAYGARDAAARRRPIG